MTDETRAWMRDAACRGMDTERFFPDPGELDMRNETLRICRRCPVKDECRQYADGLDIIYGIYGGETAVDRSKRNGRRVSGRRAPLAPERPLPACGTLPAYVRHLRRQETPCEPCLMANRRKNHKYYRKRAQ